MGKRNDDDDGDDDGDDDAYQSPISAEWESKGLLKLLQKNEVKVY